MRTEQLRNCDLVMKGGVTSGIVYPGAVCRLATKYRFRSIGGTSAGAIAAALTAAAEYARAHGHDMFTELAKVPGWLGKSGTRKQSNLLNLFQPQPALRRLFDIATAFLVKDWAYRLLRCLSALWPGLLTGFLLGAIPMVVLILTAPTWWESIPALLAFVLALVAGLVGGLCQLLATIARLPQYHYGLCTGYAPPHPNNPPTLVAWLNETINRYAGKPPEEPLTFGDLEKNGITLRMISTCLTFGRPYTLPFASEEFYYDPAELAAFFPAGVMDWMARHPPRVTKHSETIAIGALKPLPDPADLPVIVAARLSLSFPLLFCAVPLYAVDWSRRRRAPGESIPPTREPGDAVGHTEERTPERAWFSDGGICSNFPLHLFDSPLPKWPTVAINLRDRRPDWPDEEVWMPTTNNSGIVHEWTRLPTDTGLSGPFQLVSSIIESARNWVDNLQTMAPGYRDRIVHIYLTKTEGGLNLNMSDETVIALSGYGEKAGERILDHFINGADQGRPIVATWQNQRWVRYRSTLAQLQDFLKQLTDALEHPEPGDPPYADLADQPPSYKFTPVQHDAVTRCHDELTALSALMTTTDYGHGAPHPPPALRVRPKF